MNPSFINERARDGKLVTLFRDRASFFLFLALLPLVPIVLIPFYGFLIMLLKKERLQPYAAPSGLLRFLGLAVVAVSFLVFYASIAFFPSASYGVGALFYFFYILGLSLVFFNVRALKEFASAFFLVVVGGFSPYVSEWLESIIQPFVPYFVMFFYFVLSLLGIPATIHDPYSILLNRPNGRLPVSFEAGCIGIQSFLIFSIIAVVTMLEESASKRTKILWSIVGVIGTFFVNTIRVSLIAVVIFFNGYENWGVIHSVIGYTLFLLWLVLFLAMFSRRTSIRNRLRTLLHKS
jgi:exosortase/archaeosortase family protein